MILISDNCNCGETCVGGLTCHCNGQTTYICPNGNCSIPNNGNCGCGCCPPEQPLPETHRVQRLIAPSRDTHTNWSDKDPVIKEGVLGFTKDRLFNGSFEYFIGDGVHKYSELVKYAAAPASTSNDPNTLVLRDANGKIDSSSINFPTIPDATPTTKGIVKASTTKAADNAVKSDANGGLDGWKDAIIDAIIADDGSGGLATDANGNMVVDFNQMPTDKFEALLKSLKMLIPLSANMNLYVDTNSAQAADTIEDGRGTSQKPFKTIQAAVNYVVNTYALGNYSVTIHVGTGTYHEAISLPNFSHGSGSITIEPTTGLLDVIIDSNLNSAGTRRTCFSITGGDWILHRLDIRRVENPTSSSGVPGCVLAYNNGTNVTLKGCAISQSMPDSPSPLGGTNYTVRVIAADTGSTIRFDHDELPITLSTEKPSSGTPGVEVLNALRDGVVQLSRVNDGDTLTGEVQCSGSCDVFVNVNQNGKIQTQGIGTLTSFSGTVSGQKYAVNTGGSVATNQGANYFPGSIAGTVDDDTYCWYT